jgi:DNA-binding transcriptional LysR family regulator
MDIQQLRYFVAVAEEGTLRAAARRLHMAQPPLSLAMAKLERELGAPLLIRSSRGVELTHAGEVLLAESYEIINRLDAARRMVRDTARMSPETLRVGLVGGMIAAADLTAPILQAFRRDFPHIRLELRDLNLDRRVDPLVSGEIDVVIERPPYVDDRLEMVSLFSEPRVLCISAEHPLAGESELPTAEVLEVPMVEFVTTHPEQTEFWSLDTLRGGHAPRHAQSSACAISEMQLALLTGQGATTAGLSAWRFGLQTPLLRAIALPDAPPSVVALAYLRDRVGSATAAFIETAQAITQQMITLVPGGRLPA